MFCLKCGKEIDNNTVNCPYCGCSTENSNAPISLETVSNSGHGDTMGIVAIILGVLASALSLLSPMIAFIVGIIGIIISAIGYKNNKSKCSLVGLILSILGIIIAAGSLIIGLVAILALNY